MIQWSRRTYSKEEFIAAWNSSSTISECSKKLGLCGKGSGYNNLKSTAIELGLDFNHMLGSGWSRGTKQNLPKNKKPLESYLVKTNNSLPSNVKQRLFDEGLLEKKCSAKFCLTPNNFVNPFTGEVCPQPLALDHINGDSTDHRLENLRILCYNCHGLTETWVGKNKKSKLIKEDKKCSCGVVISKRATKCRACTPKKHGQQKTVIEWPEDEKLLDMIRKSNIYQVSKKLGVSDTSVRKRLRLKGYDTKTLKLLER